MPHDCENREAVIYGRESGAGLWNSLSMQLCKHRFGHITVRMILVKYATVRIVLVKYSTVRIILVKYATVRIVFVKY